MNWAAVFTGLISGGVGTTIALLLRLPSDVRKNKSDSGKSDAEAATIVAETAIELMAPLRAEAKAARSEAISAREENVKLRIEFAALRDEVRDLRAENAAYHQLHGPLPLEHRKTTRNGRKRT